MMASRVIEDYTYLWYDVRPHPNFGTVEIRVMDSQTRLEHTLALAALVQAMVKELAEHFESGQELSRYPYEMLDENKFLAARHGLGGELVDLPSRDRVRTPELARRIVDRVRGHAEDLGSANELAGIDDLLDRGTGGDAPDRGVRGQPRPQGSGGGDRRGLSTLCWSESAGPLRRLQELRVRGFPVRHGVPVLRPAGAQARPEAGARRRGRGSARQAAPPPEALAAAPGGDRGDRARHAAHGHVRADRRSRCW